MCCDAGLDAALMLTLSVNEPLEYEVRSEREQLSLFSFVNKLVSAHVHGVGRPSSLIRVCLRS